MRKTTILFLVAALIISAAGSNVEKYEVHRKTMSWKQAKEFCARQETFLAVIKSEEENELIHQLATKVLGPNKKHLVWIGLQRSGSSWTWIDGTQATYTKWISDQPDNWKKENPIGENCVHMYVATGQVRSGVDRHWNDLSCDRTDLYFVCQRYF